MVKSLVNRVPSSEVRRELFHVLARMPRVVQGQDDPSTTSVRLLHEHLSARFNRNDSPRWVRDSVIAGEMLSLCDANMVSFDIGRESPYTVDQDAIREHLEARL